MARKQKNIYTRIEEKESELQRLNEKIEQIKIGLVQLEKEKDSFEMQEIFRTAKEKDLSFDDVIKMISKNK